MSNLTIYQNYLKKICPTINFDLLSPLFVSIENTNWDNPETAIELNNFAVIALIEAEKEEENYLKSVSFELAIEALTRAVDLENNPLSLAHLALLQSLIGEKQTALETAFAIYVSTIHSYYNDSLKLPLGLVYLPSSSLASEQMGEILSSQTGSRQAILLLVAILNQSQLNFYTSENLRFLELANHHFTSSKNLLLQLGIASFIQQRWEGIYYLENAKNIDIENPQIIQALYLAYRLLEQLSLAESWYNFARDRHLQSPLELAWTWVNLPVNSVFTYIPFTDKLLLTVEANLNNIFTASLLVGRDWWEKEIDFWRREIQTGMTVIDVGTNIGIYTFTAAEKVGGTGKVIAIEPVPLSVKCLQETCRINHISCVKIYPGAASDTEETANLVVNISGEQTTTEINCFTLDSLIEKENLTNLNWLRIDAQGSELEVLQGSKTIIEKFNPGIIYNNISSQEETNYSVAKFLISLGYELYTYRAYFQDLIPIDNLEELSRHLYIIAVINPDR